MDRTESKLRTKFGFFFLPITIKIFVIHFLNLLQFNLLKNYAFFFNHSKLCNCLKIQGLSPLFCTSIASDCSLFVHTFMWCTNWTIIIFSWQLSDEDRRDRVEAVSIFLYRNWKVNIMRKLSLHVQLVKYYNSNQHNN